MSEHHAVEEESEDFQLMRRYDREWSGPRLLQIGVVTLVIAISIIYGLAQLGSGSKSPPYSLMPQGLIPNPHAR